MDFEISKKDGFISFRRTPPKSFFEKCVLIGSTGILFLLVLAAFFVVSVLVISFFDGYQWLALLVAFVLFVFSAPALYCLYCLQGLLFGFESKVNKSTIVSRTGIIARKHANINKSIVIYMVYSRGDWGIGGKTDEGWNSLAIIPNNMLGDYKDAVAFGEKLKIELEEHSCFHEVRFVLNPRSRVKIGDVLDN